MERTPTTPSAVWEEAMTSVFNRNVETSFSSEDPVKQDHQ